MARMTSRTWFAVAKDDGTYGEPHPLGDIITELVGIDDIRKSWPRSTVTVRFGGFECIWDVYARRNIWELRKRGKRSRKNRRKRHGRRQ